MSFREPALLAALALVPLALVGYVLAQRRRRQYAVRYTNVDVLAGVVARSPGRHAPAALALLALAALAIAVARPERTVAAERREATVVLVSDTSGSMLARDVAPNRLEAARLAARDFARRLPDEFRLGLISFSSRAEQQAAPSTDHETVAGALDALRARGGTAMGDGLDLGLAAARTPAPDGRGGTRRLPGAIVLLSDGANTHGSADPLAVARRARRARVPVYTVALGTSRGVLLHQLPDGGTREERVPPDVETLRQIAQLSGGQFFNAPDADQLRQVYDRLGTAVSTRPERQEVTAAFAGGALVLVLCALGLSLARSGRLP